ncbi:MAG TPA: hypothetical protein DCE44_01540, partial [Verrucomicrobiales bacterium]|nr:hypothetical protein [Verrucomicrobiales bacterium]
MFLRILWPRARGLVTLAALLTWLPAAAIVSEDSLPDQAQWMSPESGEFRGVAQFRRVFVAEPGLVKAVLLAAAEKEAGIALNGVAVGTAVGVRTAVTLDVTRLVRAGTNLLTVQVTNTTGVPVCRLMLELVLADGRQRWVVSDPTWESSRDSAGGWKPAFVHGEAGFRRWGNPFAATRSADAYNSWMLARGAEQATDPATFTVPPGFRVELLRTARPEEDSWIALAFDPQGRLTVAREQRGLIRLTLGNDQVKQVEVIEDTLLECRGLLYAHESLYVNANNSRGFYRLRDVDGDGKFEDKRLLLATEGGVGHGRNHLRLGPDGSIYLVHGDDVILPKEVSADSPVQQMANDQILPTLNPREAARVTRYLQVGHVLRTDAEGSSFQLVMGGLRNPMDVAFNEDGELFTYEADMERDIGAPWYRPTRVLHLVPGGDYGWRRGQGNLPPSAADTLPAAVDIGVGSPTGVTFAHESRFPEPWRSAFFIGDWAYGRILAVNLREQGSTYVGSFKEFLSGRPLNVTDLTFGPDGALYFVTGGRGTKSGLYRVSWTGGPVAPAKVATADRSEANARNIRRHLELTLPSTPERLDEIWANLDHADRWIRSAARRALERLPLGDWSKRALTETNASVAVNALLAVTRVAAKGGQPLIFARLNSLPLGSMNEADQLTALRIFGIALVRFGWPGEAAVKQAQMQLAALYPSSSAELNRELCRVLTNLRAPETLTKTLPLLSAATTAPERLYYLMQLWAIREGWDLDRWRTYFTALREADRDQGARDYYTALHQIRSSLTNTMGSGERLALGELIAAAKTAPAAVLAPGAPTRVKAWTLSDFDFSTNSAGRSRVRGREAFQTVGCAQCHRMGSLGGLLGPDLTAVSARFGRRDLLDHILNPSKAVDDKYRLAVLTLKDGSTVTGTIDREEDPLVILPPDPNAVPTEIPSAQIAERRWSDQSP